jgi:hypothetical protein
MSGRCPLCGQSLPEAVSKAKLQESLQKLTLPVLIAERKKLNSDFEARSAAARELAEQTAERRVAHRLRAANERARRAEQASERELRRLRKEYSDRLGRESADARRDAQNSVAKQLTEAEKRAKVAEERSRKAIEQARKDSNTQIRREVADAVRRSDRENEERLRKVQEQRERDKLRSETTVARLQGQLEEMSRKLDRLTGEQLGSEAERDLLVELQNAFRDDYIRRIGRGVRGADIVHEVRDKGKTVGRIVYESKNTGGWGKGFIPQAKRYQTQYETTHVMIVTRTFPDKQKTFCIKEGIPVVGGRSAVALATIMRDGILRIAELGLAGGSREIKSHELFEYIVSDKFSTRFREIAEGVGCLRDRQQKERTWHENSWREEDKIHNRIQVRHREVEAEIRSIVTPRPNGKSSKPAVRSEEWSKEFSNLRPA